MRARLRTVIAAVCLILLAGLLVAWARSFVPGLAVYSYRGDVVIVSIDLRIPQANPNSEQFLGPGYLLETFRTFAREKREWLGFTLLSGDFSNVTYRAVLVPYPYLVIPVAALALWAVRAARVAKQRSRERRCPDCGYDLRASPQRCPECGRDNPFVVSRPARAGAAAETSASS